MNVLLLEKPLWEVSDSSTQPGGVTHQPPLQRESHCVWGTPVIRSKVPRSPNMGKPDFASANGAQLLIHLIFPIP